MLHRRNRRKNFDVQKQKMPQNRVSSGRKTIAVSYFLINSNKHKAEWTMTQPHSEKLQFKKDLNQKLTTHWATNFYLILVHVIPKQREETAQKRPSSSRRTFTTSNLRKSSSKKAEEVRITSNGSWSAKIRVRRGGGVVERMGDQPWKF